jgi:hypothetical protein
MKLRGVFNPWVQILLTLLMAGLAAHITFTVWKSGNALLDVRLAPLALAIGLAVGYGGGRKRLKVLHQAIPVIDGQFYLGEQSAFSKIPEARSLVLWERWSYLVAVVIIFSSIPLSHGSTILWASFVDYLFGFYLTCRAFPVVWVWLESGSATDRT